VRVPLFVDCPGMPQQQVAPVEVDFDREFIEKWLDRQKYVWYAVILLLAVTLSGLLGRGPLATNTVASESGQVKVTYERVLHYRTPAVIELHLARYLLQNGPMHLRLEGALASKAAFQQIIPQPVSAAPLADGVLAEFPVNKASLQGRVTIVQQPSAVGLLDSKIGLEGGPLLEFRQFVLP